MRQQIVEVGPLCAGMLDLSQVGKPKQGRPGPRRKATEAAETDTAAILMQMATVAEGLGRAPPNKRRYILSSRLVCTSNANPHHRTRLVKQSGTVMLRDQWAETSTVRQQRLLSCLSQIIPARISHAKTHHCTCCCEAVRDSDVKRSKERTGRLRHSHPLSCLHPESPALSSCSPLLSKYCSCGRLSSV